MFSSFIRKVLSLDLEEKILNAMLVVSLLGLLFPWIGGKLSLIDDQIVSYSGLGFYTSFIGFGIFALLGFSLLITVIPLVSGNQLLPREKKDVTRLTCTGLATILILSSLSVLIKVTFTSPGMEVRFGIYVSLISAMISSLYSFLKLQETKTRKVHDLFHHPEPPTVPTTEAQERISDAVQSSLHPREGQVPTPPEPELHGQLRR